MKFCQIKDLANIQFTINTNVANLHTHTHTTVKFTYCNSARETRSLKFITLQIWLHTRNIAGKDCFRPYRVILSASCTKTL